MSGAFLRRSRGFSLIEAAIALCILAALLASVIAPLQSQIETRKYEETQRILDQARDALMGFISTYGYLPCPATTTSNGQEGTGFDHVTGNCPAGFYGFLPAAAIGFNPVDAQGYAIDAYSDARVDPTNATSVAANRIRYAVWSGTLNGITNPFTQGGGMRSVGFSAFATNPNLLYVCNSGTGVVPGSNCGTATTLTSNAPVVIWSVGANGSLRTGGTSTDETQNPHPNPFAATPFGTADRVFVMRPLSKVTGAEFDDIVTWIPLSMLINRMIAAGQMP